MAPWSPLIVGTGIGILALLSFVFARPPLGCTTAVVKVRGLIDRLLNRKMVERLEYYRPFYSCH